MITYCLGLIKKYAGFFHFAGYVSPTVTTFRCVIHLSLLNLDVGSHIGYLLHCWQSKRLHVFLCARQFNL